MTQEYLLNHNKMTKEELLKARKCFFDNIKSEISKELSVLDYFWKHDTYFIPTQLEKSIIDIEGGNLVIPFENEFFGQKFNFFYSVWQSGHILRVGIGAMPNISQAFASDVYNEIYQIWGKQEEKNLEIKNSSDFIFFDWIFDATKLYTDYAFEERIIHGMRHMHFKVLRIIFDECKKRTQMADFDEKNKDSPLLLTDADLELN